MWDQATDLFAPQGTIEIGLDGVYVGQKRIHQYLFALGGGREGLNKRPAQRTSHAPAGRARCCRWPYGKGALASANHGRTVGRKRLLG